MALELYDSIVFPMNLNADFEFLENIEAKKSNNTIRQLRVCADLPFETLLSVDVEVQ